MRASLPYIVSKIQVNIVYNVMTSNVYFAYIAIFREIAEHALLNFWVQ